MWVSAELRQISIRLHSERERTGVNKSVLCVLGPVGRLKENRYISPELGTGKNNNFLNSRKGNRNSHIWAPPHF